MLVDFLGVLGNPDAIPCHKLTDYLHHRLKRLIRKGMEDPEPIKQQWIAGALSNSNEVLVYVDPILTRQSATDVVYSLVYGIVWANRTPGLDFHDVITSDPLWYRGKRVSNKLHNKLLVLFSPTSKL